VRPREPQGAHDDQHGQEQPEQSGPYLALEQGDRCESEHQHQRHHQGGETVGAAGHVQVVRYILDACRADAE
jgi:hypothetical protein